MVDEQGNRFCVFTENLRARRASDDVREATEQSNSDLRDMKRSVDKSQGSDDRQAKQQKTSLSTTESQSCKRDDVEHAMTINLKQSDAPQPMML